MSQPVTQDDLFKILRGYETRMERLERSSTSGLGGGGSGSALTYRGPWSGSSIDYEPGDVVTYNQQSYINLVAYTSANPPAPGPDADTTHWQVYQPGPAGPAGPAGEDGADGAPGAPGLVWRGAWAAATTYAVNDAVTYNGSSYRRLVAGQTAGNPESDTTNWGLIAGGAVGARSFGFFMDS